MEGAAEMLDVGPVAGCSAFGSALVAQTQNVYGAPVSRSEKLLLVDVVIKVVLVDPLSIVTV